MSGIGSHSIRPSGLKLGIRNPSHPSTTSSYIKKSYNIEHMSVSLPIMLDYQLLSPKHQVRVNFLSTFLWKWMDERKWFCGKMNVGSVWFSDDETVTSIMTGSSSYYWNSDVCGDLISELNLFSFAKTRPILYRLTFHKQCLKYLQCTRPTVMRCSLST